ncbi:hypothetical protein NYR68_03595 [Actinobacillus equuli subsp. haemolyticus]|uniref:hypothetical protein n=1 Tax=Actinobacillus equuli TaxID=718 RepID=UPI002446727E|nr:hypothetical protein [Actinobacillus equuli]WGE51479.1 hypothetical protein NYR68_03595 [Actinobacillus equuli subsp. haemolyticus]
MKQFAELDFIKNLSWTKLFTSVFGFMAVYTSVIWALATRATDNRADYVNMRYAEIDKLEQQISVLQAENKKLNDKLPDSEKSELSKSVKTSLEPQYKEFTTENVTVVDQLSGTMITVRVLGSSSVLLNFTFPNGETYHDYFSAGDSHSFVVNNKKYQLLVTEYNDKKAKYIIREIPNQ